MTPKLRWYHTTTKEHRYVEGEQPIGWERGRLPQPKHPEASIRMKNLWADPTSVYNQPQCRLNKSRGMSQAWKREGYAARVGQAISNSLKTAEKVQWRSQWMKQQRADPNSIFNAPETERKRVAQLKLAWKTAETRKAHEDSQAESIRKGQETKRQRGTFCTSKPEEEMYSFLSQMYPNSRIERHYWSPQYPFACDFYVEAIDEFIELNAHWTHGPHPFDPTNEEDQRLLEHWRSKQGYLKNGRRNSYFKAEEVWTQRDPAKLACAKKAGIRYVMIYKEGAIFI